MDMPISQLDSAEAWVLVFILLMDCYAFWSGVTSTGNTLGIRPV